MSFALQLLVGWLLADFLSGLLHWIEDRVLREGDTWLSRVIVEPNRLHHAEPLRFLANGFWARNATTWAIVLPLTVAWFAAIGPSLVLLAAAIGGLLANEVHRLTHAAPAKGSWLRALQDIGVIQSPRMHARHHRGRQDQAYCVLTDWLNPVLDKIRFWERLERMLRIREPAT